MHETLKDRDYVVILARNAFRKYPPPPGLKTAWTQAESAIVDLAQQCEAFDPDGITVYTTALPCHKYDHTTSQKITEIFREYQPVDTVNLTDVLQIAIENYFHRKAQAQAKPNGAIILVILDSEPDDRMEMVNLIVETTQRMERNEELGISFIQVGEDLLARGFLQSLDDDLHQAGAKFDMVDTKVLDKIEEGSLTQILLDAIYD